MQNAKLFDTQDDDPNSANHADAVMSVLVPYPIDKAYDYKVPDGLSVAPGDYVCVPLGNREVPAVVWGAPAGDVSSKKLKAIVTKYSIEPMPGVHRKFLDWVAKYTMSAKGFVLKMSLSAPAGLEPPKPVKGYVIGEAINDKTRKGLSPQRQAVLGAVSGDQVYRAAELAEAAGCSAAVIKGMADKGLLRETTIYAPAPCKSPDPDKGQNDLSDDQAAASQAVIDALKCDGQEGGDGDKNNNDKGRFETFLLDGVTGAGKTETYFEAVAEAIRQDKQVVLLLPEIALSNAFLDRFRQRFGVAPALWHSHLTPAQRRNTWRGVAQGQTKVVVGARSALFLPYQNLGLIIVDEEHDPAYKQEDGVMYNARDMAVMRAAMGKFPIMLVSATPSLETIHNAWNGRYTHLHLKSRFGGAFLPDIHVIDMRSDKPDRQCFISASLKKATIETLERKEQVLYFLNRRGYAPLTLCRSCGHRMNCSRCTAWLVEHKSRGHLECHHCGFHQRLPKECPECGDVHSFAACGPGVERIEEEAKNLFPESRVMTLASDTTESNEALKEKLEKVRAGEVDIIIGTQIIAKGHHFPNLTCVGVIDADLGLQGGDLRAAERTYQLLHQVAGRAGREAKKGAVYLQSFMPDHKIMEALEKGERDAFLEAESWEREQAHMPPYSRLAGIIVSGREEQSVIATARELGRLSPQGENEQGLSVYTLGPAQAPMAMLRGRHRHRLLVNADRAVNLQKIIQDWVSQVKVPSTVRVQIDIDPQSFL